METPRGFVHEFFDLLILVAPSSRQVLFREQPLLLTNARARSFWLARSSTFSSKLNDFVACRVSVSGAESQCQCLQIFTNSKSVEVEYSCSVLVRYSGLLGLAILFSSFWLKF